MLISISDLFRERHTQIIYIVQISLLQYGLLHIVKPTS